MLQNMHSHKNMHMLSVLKKITFPLVILMLAWKNTMILVMDCVRNFDTRGIVTEAGKAIVEQVKKDGLPYITATHDKNNPRSGNVMKIKKMTNRNLFRM